MDDLGALPRWMDFHKGWAKFFRQRTGKPFTYEVVNGHCALAAKLYVEYRGEGIEQYGFFLGQRPNPYWRSRAFVRHAWVKLGEQIHDPTRWCFHVAKRPQLAIVSAADDAYDFGMNRVRSTFHPAVPPEYVGPAVPEVPGLIVAFFGSTVDEPQLAWLANCSPDHPWFLTPQHYRLVIEWFVRSGRGAWVPYDNRKAVGL